MAPLLRSAVATRPLIPGAVGEVQLPSSDCVVRRKSIASLRAASTLARSTPELAVAAESSALETGAIKAMERALIATNEPIARDGHRENDIGTLLQASGNVALK